MREKQEGITIGVDSGSSTTKAVVMKDNEIVGEGWIPTTDPVESADEVIESALTGAGISRTDVDAIGVTGHGRELVGKHVKAALNLEEVSVIAKGAALLSRQHKGDATVIDIGGMNNKLILMRDGIATSFNLGGICGGSSGRFLEVASNRLDVDAIGVTGHGRELVGKHVKAALNLEEVSVIAKGAALLSRQHKGDATVIDIGGMNNINHCCIAFMLSRKQSRSFRDYTHLF